MLTTEFALPTIFFANILGSPEQGALGGTKHQMAATVPFNPQHFSNTATCSLYGPQVPSRSRFAFSRDKRAGSSWQLLAWETGNSKKTYFAQEIRSAPFLSLTHSHPQLGCRWRSTVQWSESWDCFQPCHGGFYTAQTNFFLFTTRSCLRAQTQLLIYLLGGRTQALLIIRKYFAAQT